MLEGMIHLRVRAEIARPQPSDAYEGPLGLDWRIEPYAAEERRWLECELDHVFRRVSYGLSEHIPWRWRLTIEIAGRCGSLKTVTTADLSPRLRERLLTQWVDHISSWRTHQKQITTGSDFSGKPTSPAG